MDPNISTQSFQTQTSNTQPNLHQQTINKITSPGNKWNLIILIIILLIIVLGSLCYLGIRQNQFIEQNQDKTSENINLAIKPTQIPTPTLQPTPKIRILNNNYMLFTNEDLNISFEYPTIWGKLNILWNGENYLMATVFSNISKNENSGIVLAATNPLSNPPGRGAFWGDSGRTLKTEEDFKLLCPEQNELCKSYKNNYGITVIKKNEYVGVGIDAKGSKSSQYYIYNPNSLYSSIIVSDERFDKKIVPNAEKEVENLVNSLRFIK
jgi:hypothetical protein